MKNFKKLDISFGIICLYIFLAAYFFLFVSLKQVTSKSERDLHEIKIGASFDIPKSKLSLNINEANELELTQIKGIGRATAKKIIKYRTEHGRFKSTEELSRIKGIGKKKAHAIAEQVSF